MPFFAIFPYFMCPPIVPHTWLYVPARRPPTHKHTHKIVFQLRVKLIATLPSGKNNFLFKNTKNFLVTR